MVRTVAELEAHLRDLGTRMSNQIRSALTAARRARQLDDRYRGANLAPLAIEFEVTQIALSGAYASLATFVPTPGD